MTAKLLFGFLWRPLPGGGLSSGVLHGCTRAGAKRLAAWKMVRSAGLGCMGSAAGRAGEARGFRCTVVVAEQQAAPFVSRAIKTSDGNVEVYEHYHSRRRRPAVAVVAMAALPNAGERGRANCFPTTFRSSGRKIEVWGPCSVSDPNSAQI